MATKKLAPQKAAAARQAAAEQRAKQRAANRRTTILSVLGALALVTVFVLIVLFIVNGEKKDSGPYAVYNNGVLKAPSTADEDGGIFVSLEGVAGGTPPAGAVEVEIWSDPLCPICKQFDLGIAAEFNQLRADGRAALIHHPIAILDWAAGGSFYSTRSVSAIGTVAEHAPEWYGAVIEALYENQPPEGIPGLTNEEIAAVLRGAGVPEDVISGLPEDDGDGLARGEFTEWVYATAEQASVGGIGGTPTIRIAGIEQPFGYYLYFPGLLTHDVTVVERGGASAFAEVAAERERVLTSGATEEESLAAFEALLNAQLTKFDEDADPANG